MAILFLFASPQMCQNRSVSSKFIKVLTDKKKCQAVKLKQRPRFSFQIKCTQRSSTVETVLGCKKTDILVLGVVLTGQVGLGSYFTPLGLSSSATRGIWTREYYAEKNDKVSYSSLCPHANSLSHPLPPFFPPNADWSFFLQRFVINK